VHVKDYIDDMIINQKGYIVMELKILTCNTLHTLDFTPTIVMGFYQDIRERHFLQHYNILKEKYPNVDVIGCSSESNIYDQIPYIENDSKCVFLCLNMQRKSYQVHILNHIENNLSLAVEDNYNAIMLSSKYFVGIEKLISDIQHRLNGGNVFGAIASSLDSLSNNATIFYDGKFFKDSTLLWLIDKSYYSLEGLSIHQFEPVGFELIVTKCINDTIYELDHRPALKVLEEIVGHITPQNIQSFDFPFFLKQHDNVSFENTPLCSIKTIDSVANSIVLYRYVKEHDKLKLAIPVSLQEQEERLNWFHRFHTEAQSVALLFNCVGIKAYLGMMEFVYLMDLKHHLKMPFLGFHSFGEIGPLEVGKKSIVHNQTISLAILSPAKDIS